MKRGELWVETGKGAIRFEEKNDGRPNKIIL